MAQPPGHHPELSGTGQPGVDSGTPNLLPAPGVREPLGGRIPDMDPGWIHRQPTGPIPGGVVLPDGRVARPVGTPIPVGLLPLGLALSPDGRWLAALNDGEVNESISLIDTRTNKVISTTPISKAFVGITFSADGAHLFVAEGGGLAVAEYTVDPSSGALTSSGAIPVPGYPTGLALSSDGSRLLCAENYGNHVAVIDPSSGKVTSSLPAGHMPYGVAAAANGGAWVTGWSDGTLQEIGSDGTPLASFPVGKLAGPVAISPGGRYVYAASTNEDRMIVVDTQPGTPPYAPRLAGTVSFAPYPDAPVGSVPGAIAVNPVSGDVYVALSGLNCVAVVDPALMTVRGLIPTGWYPAALAVSPDGSQLYVAAAKGLGSGPNKVSRKSVAVLDYGIVYAVPLTGPESADTGLAAWTRQVADSNLFTTPDKNVKLPPIQHVIYIVKENRTYDQVLGDLGRGNGDPTLAFYGKRVTPNTHALADRFAIGDNFYSDGEVSSQGHEWTLAANSSDYTERTWPQIYAGHARLDDISSTPISYPAGGFLIHSCLEHGVSCRMYGDEVMRDSKGHLLPGLADLKSKTYRGWNLNYMDIHREEAWAAEFKKGIFPRYSYVWLPSDHTAGTRVGSHTPEAMVADNDLALGRLVDTVSHSPEWKDTVIFVSEDDSQAGLDHVDGHRNILLVISPWVRPGMITSQHYSQVSISRTIELLLGIPPLSQFDAQTQPILDVFSDHPDLTPYQAVPETVDINARNTTASVMTRESARLDLKEPDASNPELEKILVADARARHILR
ncbi:MAG TPA: bifunctional YncE family protein/alkaline phosphatase family protein [Armatimonadota bacterium]|nr:bifunctional YncE family protein/alkaline phosphatase family protein [Armatimonadota bacterium]